MKKEIVFYSNRGHWLSWIVKAGEDAPQEELDSQSAEEIGYVLAACDEWPRYKSLTDQEKHDQAEADCEYKEYERQPYDGDREIGFCDSGANG